MESSHRIITRMAPSPTGLFHVGSLRTTIFNYLFARQNKGTFILRIEDTDKERSKSEYEQNIIESLDWLNLSYDAFYRQSERTEIYRQALQKLIDQGHAYEAEDNQSGDGKVIRFKNPGQVITFQDLILGEISSATDDLGDFVIARDMENPLYHLSVVVDDGEMGITHVIRGQDHISNTPRQILLLEALGYQRPHYAHIPLILGTDKSKLSKRKGTVAVTEYRAQGYTRDALINFMALLGWNPGTDDEIFSCDELLQLFDLTKVQKGGAVFNPEKLDWVNKQWLNKMSFDEFENYIKPHLPQYKFTPEQYETFLNMIRERINKSSDITMMLETGEFDYLKDTHPQYPQESLVWKKSDMIKTMQHLQELHTLIKNISPWEIDNVKSSLMTYAETHGKGDVLWPLRYALSGKEKSPDPFTLLMMLGQEKSLSRITHALDIITMNPTV